MPDIEILSTGLVYRNPQPHLCSKHAYFPSVVELPSGELLATMDIGSAFEAVDVRSYSCRSSDGGHTWSKPSIIFEPDVSSHPVSTTCRVSLAPNGELVGWMGLFDRTRVDIGLANPATDGFVETRMAIIQSNNGGRSWSVPEPVVPPVNWQHFEICSPIIFLDRDRWLIPCSVWSDWNGQNPYGLKAVAFRSDDGGRTWPAMVDVFNKSPDRIAFWEQKQVKLSDKRLMAICWAYDYKTKNNIPNHYTFSEDNGYTYSKPFASPLNGETCTPTALADNRILCIYRRIDKRGLWAHLARIEDKTWHPITERRLWGSDVQAHSTEQESVISQMSTLRFGYPSVISLASREIFLVFWCVEDCVSNIRWYKLRVL